MKTRLMMFVAVIALFVFNGCSDSKESYVKDFKKFIEKVEAAGSDYTEEDWKKADEKFETGIEINVRGNAFLRPFMLGETLDGT